MKKVTGILTAMILLCFPAYSQSESLTDSLTKQKSKVIDIYFNHNISEIDLELNDNRHKLEKFKKFINELQADTLKKISRIEIISYTSPEGDRTFNKKLSTNRTNSICDYLVNTICVPDSIITKLDADADWEGLYNAVQSSEMDRKDEVLDILKNIPEETWGKVDSTDQWLKLIDSRNKHLMDLYYGRPYHWMQENIFPLLRRGSVATIYFQTINPPVIEEETKLPIKAVAEQLTEEVHDTITVAEQLTEEVHDTIAVAEQLTEEVHDTKTIAEQLTPVVTESKNNSFGIKTNLLQLGVGVVNFGVELQLNKSFSVDIPLSYSPYVISKEWDLKTLALQPEFRYWFNEPFKGHFFGAHLHAAYFTVRLNGEDRHQNTSNTPLWGGGLSYGYALSIGNRLNLEFNIGFGYANITYDTYYNIDNGALYNTNQHLDYLGITRAGVSLIYMFNLK